MTVTLGASPAAAAPVLTCGSTVTTDVTLTADLHCPSGDGLILGSNVTLDLGGHSLTGSGSGVGVQTEFLSEGGNTIRNGTIENWGTGILLQEQNPNHVPYIVSDVVLLGAPLSHYVGNMPMQVTRVTAVDSPISGQLGGDLAISQSTLTRSPVDVFYATAIITDSTLIQSSVSSTAQGQVNIDSSRLDGKGTSAVGYVSETVLTITNSTVKNYAQPITGFWGGVTLTDNKFTNMANGVLGDVSSNIGSDGTSEIVGNTFTRSGVVLRGNVPMIVEDNTFKHNDVGVEFTRSAPFPGEPVPTADGSRAVGNVLMKNSGTGILTDLPGLAVGDNTAKNNGGYGIYAPGAVDLGGNVAFGNALGQCVGVVCTRK
ncbi:right-handed parallel beta-helix repeat-containing protein [Mycetocola sp. 2940]|uniref:right-handed parallel beta-helix repeat-containing protein n=1 Tax=Mycetocola sp. 2940 TaxID=3156452 RepID=UPI00339283B5